jgi:hypothetical protein
MENDLDLVDLENLGEKGDKLILIKTESPIGIDLKKKSFASVNLTPKKMTRVKIELGEKITLGGKIIKICSKKRENKGDSKPELFYATSSPVIKISQNKKEDVYYVYTLNSKYKVVVR